MDSRRQFLQKGGLGFLSSLLSITALVLAKDTELNGFVVNEDEGEALRLRDGKAILKIKIARVQGAETISFLSESLGLVTLYVCINT